MWRKKSAKSLLCFGATVFLLAACGSGQLEGGGAEALASEVHEPTVTEAQSSLPLVATTDSAPEAGSVIEVRVVGDAPIDETTSSSASVDQPVESTPTAATAETSPVEPEPTMVVTPAPTTTAGGSVEPNSGLTYKGILAAGDDSITAFDNARRVVRDLFLADGVQAGNLIELSRQTGEQVGGVRATTVGGIEQAMGDLDVGDGDACILFLTSHGSQQAWFVSGAEGLTPDKLDQILSASCGDRPTVALISACYSGIFTDSLARANRVVLTAASATNTSFGCSPEATYTYWDACLIDHFAQATTWEDLYRRVTGCIESKEVSAGVTPSSPQAHFGADVVNMAVLDR